MPHAQEAPAILIAEPRHADRVFGVLMRAFAADPPNRWMYPDDATFRRHFPTFARALGGGAIAAGTAFVAPDFSGAALWLAPGAGPDEAAIMTLIEETVVPEKQETLAAVIEAMGRTHPEEPHWYLSFVGVDPARQGRGVGTALLGPILARCDTAGLPAYLESTNARNRPLYERLGFRVMGEIVAGDCPPVIPMLRRPVAVDPRNDQSLEGRS
jgi:ribosomal protein S18 acetylase RimI-like enzyme